MQDVANVQMEVRFLHPALKFQELMHKLKSFWLKTTSVLLSVLALSSCVSLHFDMSDPYDTSRVVYYDVDTWVSVILNENVPIKEYRNMELKCDKTSINWGRYECK